MCEAFFILSMFNFKEFRFKQSLNTDNTGFKKRSPFANLSSSGLSANKVFLLVFAALILLGLFLFLRAVSTGIPSSATSLVDGKVNLPVAKATQKINKEFTFPLKNSKGEEVSKLKVVLQNAELKDQIIVKTQRISAISGRTFLVLNIKITNEYNKTVQMTTRDYFRISLNNGKELLAPEIHNDPVEVQATSTKYTRVGLPIDDNVKNIKLYVGEINGEKATIDLNF